MGLSVTALARSNELAFSFCVRAYLSRFKSEAEPLNSSSDMVKLQEFIAGTTFAVPSGN